MSKRKIEPDAPTESQSRAARAVGLFRGRKWAVLIIAVLAVGGFGAVMKQMQESAREQNRLRPEQRSALSAINPFVVSPSPTPTPQLSKEYIYAGSRLLAVEDAGANAAPPADLAVWRPSTGQWWVLGGPGSQQVTVQWGGNGDVPVPGDYDGDGKTDFAVFRKDDPSAGNATWYILKSSDSSWYVVPYGVSSDTPVPADFDGDGKTDIAVYRKNAPSSGNATWYILQSSDGSTWYQQFGLTTDTPFPADHDGDGRADMTVWRASANTFYCLRSSTGSLETFNFTVTSTNPVSADYDGDGRADFAIRNGANWIIRRTSDSVTQTTAWEQAGDIAVPNDYDGDGLVDIAVWRPVDSPKNTLGHWYIKQSSNGQPRDEAWGTTGDIPVPAYYRR